MFWQLHYVLTIVLEFLSVLPIVKTIVLRTFKNSIAEIQNTSNDVERWKNLLLLRDVAVKKIVKQKMRTAGVVLEAASIEEQGGYIVVKFPHNKQASCEYFNHPQRNKILQDSISEVYGAAVMVLEIAPEPPMSPKMHRALTLVKDILFEGNPPKDYPITWLWKNLIV